MTAARLAARLDAVLRGEEVGWDSLGTSPAALVEACAECEISGLVHLRLRDGAGLWDWPEEVRAELARAAHAAAATALLRAREIATVLDALAAGGVRPILLKGAPLAYAVYDAPGSRAHVDADMMVRRDQVGAVKRITKQIGYGEPRLSDGELLFCQFQLEKVDRYGVRHVFDIHWKISTQTVFADVLTYDDLAAAAEPVPALGSQARAAGRVHALLLACIHPAMHHRNAGRLIWQYDVHLLVSRLSAGELDAFAALAVDRRVAAICLNQLTRARAQFHTVLPERLTAALLVPPDPEPTAAYLQPGRRWHDELSANLWGLTHRRDRLRLLREVFLPRPRYMLDAYRLGRAGLLLLPALYVHRCLRGVARILTGRK